jgi:hypothetical protein
LFWTFAGAALVTVDFKFGPILPDPIYCFVKAGDEIRTPETTRATSWAIGRNGCDGGRDPRCALEYQTTPARDFCSHETLWDAWSPKLGLGDPRKKPQG